MKGIVFVRPVGNILDIWDKNMEPFDPDGEKSDNGEGEEAGEGEGNEETISLEEEEGVKARIGKMERAPTKEEVAA